MYVVLCERGRPNKSRSISIFVALYLLCLYNVFSSSEYITYIYIYMGLIEGMNSLSLAQMKIKFYLFIH